MAEADILEKRELRDRIRVFRDRSEAGEVLAGLLLPWRERRPVVLAIPAGGVPVAARVARGLGCCLRPAVVSKITLPWNSEAGYGAVAFDGTVRLNERLLPALGLSEEQIQAGIARTRQKVQHRVSTLGGHPPFLAPGQETVILVDDGLASGFTMKVAVEALRRCGVKHLVVAVPTGHRDAVAALAPAVATICCANIRGGWSFAVADAYEHWRDVPEWWAARLLRHFARKAEAAQPPLS